MLTQSVPSALTSLEHEHYSLNFLQYVVTAVRGIVPSYNTDSIVFAPETVCLLKTPRDHNESKSPISH